MEAAEEERNILAALGPATPVVLDDDGPSAAASGSSGSRDRVDRGAGGDGTSAGADGGRTDDDEVIVERGTRGKPRVVQAEAGVQADASPEGWQSFSLGHALQLLHSINMGVVRRTLRRLHVRFWQMPAKRLSELLAHAGERQAAIRLVG